MFASILMGIFSRCAASVAKVRGKYAYFFDRYDSNGDLFYWEIGKKQPQLLGKIDGMVRGLSNRENNHFLSISEEFVKLYRIINDDEFN
jgi:hypothetical protein